MNNKAYINGIEVSLEFASIYHDVKGKLALGVKLTPYEEGYLYLFKSVELEKLFGGKLI